MLQNETDSSTMHKQSSDVVTSVPGKDGPPFVAIDRAEVASLSLSQPGAQTTARNRWERLTIVNDIPAPAEEIWKALTEPEALGQWFGVCYGSLAQPGRECVLDFEDGEFFLCRTIEAHPPHYLQYYWRWMGIGPAWTVTWQIEQTGENAAHVT